MGFGDYFWFGSFLAQKEDYIYNVERGITPRLSGLVLIVSDTLICVLWNHKQEQCVPDERINLLLCNGERKLAM